jgi:hypothetical protein
MSECSTRRTQGPFHKKVHNIGTGDVVCIKYTIVRSPAIFYKNTKPRGWAGVLRKQFVEESFT